VEADKVKIYYDQLARSFGFKKEEITDGDLKGKFWVRTASATVTDKITFSENKITAEESSYEGTTLPGARIEAHADDRSVGAIEIVFENDNAYVRGIGLAPEYRGRGIGQILYDRAIAFAKKEGCHDFYSDKANAMSKDADKAWNRLRGATGLVSNRVRMGTTPRAGRR
jgi:GNAT superfamily N-acetyltransferase